MDEMVVMVVMNMRAEKDKWDGSESKDEINSVG